MGGGGKVALTQSCRRRRLETVKEKCHYSGLSPLRTVRINLNKCVCNCLLAALFLFYVVLMVLSLHLNTSYYYTMPRTPEGDRIVAVKPNNTRVVFVSAAEAAYFNRIETLERDGGCITILLGGLLVIYRKRHFRD